MANNLAAFTPIKYSLQLVKILYNDTLYPWITNTDYEGTIKDSGDRVRVRTSARIALSAYTKGLTLVSQDLNPTQEDLIVDQQSYFKFVVDDIDKFQNDIPTIETYAANSKRDMSELIDTNILLYGRKNVKGNNAVGTDYSTGTIAVAVSTGVVTGVGTTFTAAMVGGYFAPVASTAVTQSTVFYLVTAFTSATSITILDLDGVAYTGGAVGAGASYVIKAATAIALTSANVYAQLVAVRTALGQALCPKEGRFIVVNAQFEGLLMQSPQFIPAVIPAYQDVVKNGLIGRVAGFEVYTSELISGDNTTGYWFLAGTKDFMAFALQIMKTSVVPSESDPNTFVSTCKGLLVFGRKVFAGNRGRGAVLRGTLS